MSGHAVKKIDDMEAVYLGAFKRARAELGVESFGLQILDLPPNYDNYPEHDHEQDGQEEVYVALRGSCEIEIEGIGGVPGGSYDAPEISELGVPDPMAAA